MCIENLMLSSDYLCEVIRYKVTADSSVERFASKAEADLCKLFSMLPS